VQTMEAVIASFRPWRVRLGHFDSFETKSRRETRFS